MMRGIRRYALGDMPAVLDRTEGVEVVKRNIGVVGAAALVMVSMLAGCAAPGGGSGSGTNATSTSKVQAYGVLDAGVAVAR
ncbi:hypothetical protein PAQ31011_04094 [Pandoraea aquatica]|uniref:Uncharacterized protein n=1 Tax=Pandoraea aquatica TaxID=2508290 RepID=A0A5E4XSN7_9BURK|nr:hypothetical protein PAQ31011_04094 [Pandoraea aquatica]